MRRTRARPSPPRLGPSPLSWCLALGNIRSLVGSFWSPSPSWLTDELFDWSTVRSSVRSTCTIIDRSPPVFLPTLCVCCCSACCYRCCCCWSWLVCPFFAACRQGFQQFRNFSYIFISWQSFAKSVKLCPQLFGFYTNWGGYTGFWRGLGSWHSWEINRQ